ncbi:GH32 C-terminal domain-containing protein [Corynebacterium aquilae]|uniref:beta-fructofuranosidase n=1 Tax=Corynebacterium aquilae DSM 44791 TaxID=1431546 RepID=A0A1L7CF82_9CORY|nr:GH32 C-terminal domain-containing protein [Corynebacterium aquilae]APT84487.1 hypothetical protein CAQU_04775 [Corynebacterium aquilae DSM 44791]
MVYRPQRPELHITAETGVLNAPAGAIVAGDTWHIFHQYRPTPDSPSRWAHQVSFGHAYDWDVCTDVIASSSLDNATEDTNIWAGSAVPHAAGAALYFTSATPTTTALTRAIIEDLSDTVEHLDDDIFAVDDTVHIQGPIIDDIPGYSRLRSPCVLPAIDGQWRMLLCADDDHGASRMLLASSADGQRFTCDGAIDFVGDTGIAKGTRLVSPRLIRLRDEVTEQLCDIFITTVEEGNRDHTGYLVGNLEGTTFTVTHGFRPIDYGHDFTRPRNTNVIGDETFDTATIFGLLNGAGRFDDGSAHATLDTEGWANCLSLPRQATLQDGTLYQTPTPGLRAAITTSARAAAWTGLIDTSTGSVTVTVADDTGKVAATVTHAGDTLTLERGATVEGNDNAPAVAPLIAADSDTLTVIVDGCTIEVFADGGVVAMASRIDFSGEPVITASTTGGAKILHSDIISAQTPLRNL